MLRQIKELIKWTGHRKKRLYIGFFLSFLITIFTAMPIMIAAYGLDQIFKQGPMEGHSLPILQMSLWIGLSLVLRFICAYWRARLQESIGHEVTAEERIQIGDILKRVPLGYFDQHPTGELVSAVTTDLSFIEMFGMKMVDVVVNGYISALTLALTMTLFNWKIGLVCMMGMGGSGYFLSRLKAKSHKNASKHQKAQDQMIGATVEYLRGIPTIKAFKQQGLAIAAIQKAYDESKKVNIKIEKDYLMDNSGHLLVLRLTSLALVWVSAYESLEGHLSLAMFLMMAMFSFVIYGHIEAVNNAVHVLEIIEETLGKLDQIHQAKYIDAQGKAVALKAYDISFEQVTFAYEKSKVLDQITLKIPQGKVTAVVGPSGSGKTTLCHLIPRFYDPQEGQIKVGGVPIQTMTCESLLAYVSMVFQKVYLFRDSIYNNIKFGCPHASREEVIEAAKKACCHDFIMALPQGYETLVGDGGSTLSGGEKQRISIARALLKDAPIILLDEATASIDPENEQEIQQALGALMVDKTTLIIAHRLNTIQSADQIVVLDKGRIVQQGKHQDLIDQEGIYKRFMAIRSQAESWVIQGS